MQNQPKAEPQPASRAEDEKTQKARMLISLLGADFTRSATHPFFRRLSQTAIGKTTETESSKPADVSGALADLLSALNDSDKPVRPKPAPPPQPVSAAPKATPITTAKPEPADRQDPLQHQHPAIIAREIRSMPQMQKTAFIKGLSGRLARQVAIYSKELGP